MKIEVKGDSPSDDMVLEPTSVEYDEDTKSTTLYF
jgi:hypothetical protein